MNKVAEVKLSYSHVVKAKDRIKINGSFDAEKVFRENWNDDMDLQETFYLMLLDRSNKVLGIKEISKGGVAGTVVDPKIIFSTALKAMASSIIVAHNHPSGNLRPSETDKSLTKKIVEGGKLLTIDVLDSLILTSESYVSLADEGMMS